MGSLDVVWQRSGLSVLRWDGVLTSVWNARHPPLSPTSRCQLERRSLDCGPRRSLPVITDALGSQRRMPCNQHTLLERSHTPFWNDSTVSTLRNIKRYSQLDIQAASIRRRYRS